MILNGTVTSIRYTHVGFGGLLSDYYIFIASGCSNAKTPSAKQRERLPELGFRLELEHPE